MTPRQEWMAVLALAILLILVIAGVFAWAASQDPEPVAEREKLGYALYKMVEPATGRTIYWSAYGGLVVIEPQTAPEGK